MILSRIISEIPTLSLMDVSLIRQTECSSLTTFSLSLSQPDLQKSTFPLVALRRRFVLINNENGNVCRARRSQWRFTILTRSRSWSARQLQSQYRGLFGAPLYTF